MKPTVLFRETQSLSTEGCIEEDEMSWGLELTYKMHTVDNGFSPHFKEVNLYKEGAGLVY